MSKFTVNGMKLIYPCISENIKFPQDFQRVIFQYVGKSTEEINELINFCKLLQITHTYEPCNLEYRSIRLLISCWCTDCLTLKHPMFFEALNTSPLDGRIMIITPLEGSTPLRVVSYMKEGSKHFNRTEIFLHETLCFEVGRLIRKERKFFDYFMETHSSNVGEFLVKRSEKGSVEAIVGTFKFWYCFLNSLYIPLDSLMYEEVKEAFVRFFPSTNVMKQGEYEID